MKIVEVARIATLTALLCLTSSRGALLAQGEVYSKGAAVPQAASTLTIDSINVEYERELIKIERQRLEHLGRLALSQPKDHAAVTLDAYFRLAIAKNLYADATPLARKVIATPDTNPSVAWLAYLVQIVGEADRGAYEESLQSLSSAIQLKGKSTPGVAQADGIPLGTKVSIIDAYYQRLVHGDQIDVARKAMKLILDNSDVPAIRELATRRLKQLDLVGRIAPTIAGVDLEGKPYKLADSKGEVVLVVFWATWCLPNAQEMPWIDYLYRMNQPKGLRIVGINLDSVQENGHTLQSAMPNIRRFLLDYNVTWPTLINGSGDQDFAGAFGVTEIPASVLIGRDGKISHLDLTGKKLEKAIAEAVAQKP